MKHVLIVSLAASLVIEGKETPIANPKFQFAVPEEFVPELQSLLNVAEDALHESEGPELKVTHADTLISQQILPFFKITAGDDLTFDVKLAEVV